MTKRIRHWIPSAMEQKCLTHLDRPGSWQVLHVAEEPQPIERIGWRHVKRIFTFNLALFEGLVVLLLFAMSAGSGESREEVTQDLPYGLALATLVAIGMAIYAANLYRLAWNRRAVSLAGEDKPS